MGDNLKMQGQDHSVGAVTLSIQSDGLSGALRCPCPSTVMERCNTSVICLTDELNKDDFLVFQYSNWHSILSSQAFLIQKDSNHNFPYDDTLKNLF